MTRERMTLERARTEATLSKRDVADLLGISERTVDRRHDDKRRRIPGRIEELAPTVRYRAAAVVAWLTEERGASGKTNR